MALCLFACALLSTSAGPSGFISPLKVVKIISARLMPGIQTSPQRGELSFAEQQLVVWNLRLPRVIVAILVGAALSVAGALMQTLFQNALAEPYLVGTSSGAALGGVTSLILGGNFEGWAGNQTALCAFAGALFSLALVCFLANDFSSELMSSLLLTGIALGGVLSAITSFLLLQSELAMMRSALSWMMGSLAYLDWEQVMILLPYVAVGISIAMAWHRELDLLAIGSESAHHSGIPVKLTRALLLIAASLLAAVSVAFCGIIAFVGLMVPHFARMFVGPRHSALLPGCVLGGGLLLLGADTLARVLLQNQEIPIGIVTSILGGCFFIYLIRRQVA